MNQQPNFARLLLLIAVGWFLVSVLSPKTENRKRKTDPPVISSEIDKASDQADALLKRHIRDVIEQLENGQLTDERECRDLLAAGVKASRDAAWADIKAADVAAFADGWTPAKQIERLRKIIGE